VVSRKAEGRLWLRIVGRYSVRKSELNLASIDSTLEYDNSRGWAIGVGTKNRDQKKGYRRGACAYTLATYPLRNPVSEFPLL
jgi:hypothetical protein